VLRSGKLEQYYQIDPKIVDAGRGREEPADLRPRLGGLDDGQHLRQPRDDRRHQERPHRAHGHRVHDTLADWYTLTTRQTPVGFFQIGGGIAGDFPICVVPMLRQDLEADDVPLWGYFCQISDSTTSYGSYSGPCPTRRSPGRKLDITTPKYMIESTPPSLRR
jgi:deoxyhypusine synthase